jgi:hypothetical protein
MQGSYVEEVGGGICQAVLARNLKASGESNHLRRQSTNRTDIYTASWRQKNARRWQGG